MDQEDMNQGEIFDLVLLEQSIFISFIPNYTLLIQEYLDEQVTFDEFTFYVSDFIRKAEKEFIIVKLGLLMKDQKFQKGEKFVFSCSDLIYLLQEWVGFEDIIGEEKLKAYLAWVFLPYLNQWQNLTKPNLDKMRINNQKINETHFLIVIQESLHVREKNQYIELIKKFLTDKMNAEKFCFSFIARYKKINLILEDIKQDLKLNSQIISDILGYDLEKKYGINELFISMYDKCNEFISLKISNEENLKNFVKIFLAELERA